MSSHGWKARCISTDNFKRVQDVEFRSIKNLQFKHSNNQKF